MRASVFIRKAVRKILKPFYLAAVDELAVCDLAQNDPAEEPHPFECRALCESDIDKLADEIGREKAETFRGRLAHSTGYAAFEDGHIAGWAWTCDRLREHEGGEPLFYDIDPQDGYVYIYDVFVQPEWRRRGVVTAVMGHMLCAFRDKGYSRAFMTFDVRTTAMRRLAERYGFRIIGRLHGCRVLGCHTSETSALRAVCKNV